jgi:putative transposase
MYLVDCADGNTIREYVNAAFQLEHLDCLEAALNAALTRHVPRKVRRGKWELAIDFHDQPLYGKSPELRAYACRGEARDGTTWFFRIATASVLADGIRLTLAVHFVRPGESLLSILERLIERALAHIGGLKCLYLDKGFASIEVFRLLDERKLSSIIACPIRGKNGGTKALCIGHKSYTTEHAFTSTATGAYRAHVSPFA